MIKEITNREWLFLIFGMILGCIAVIIGNIIGLQEVVVLDSEDFEKLTAVLIYCELIEKNCYENAQDWWNSPATFENVFLENKSWFSKND